ncbi:hypothetical protein ACFQZQ_02975 [Lysobacter koreensis]|uniref:DUF2570 domain-containing protein n=1 Tax=Lysobacter koreensis TaxID=266122 RepID=A0ABW2YIL4_9GAMM
MIWLARYWKPIAVLVLLLAVYGWGRMDGKTGAEWACNQGRLADYVAAQKRLIAEQARTAKAEQALVDALGKIPRTGQKVINAVRANPTPDVCVASDPVVDSLQDGIDAGKAATR